MLSASNLITNQISNTQVETEIYLININILNYVAQSPYTGPNVIAIDANSSVMVNNVEVIGTPMTSDTVYYGVWQGTIGNNFKAAEMQTVIDNYKKLGYTINRKSADGVSLYWLIGW